MKRVLRAKVNATPPLLRICFHVAALGLAVGCTTMPTTVPSSNPTIGLPTTVPTVRPSLTAVTDGLTPTPVAGESETPGDSLMCDEQDLELDHGLVEGAAGSRFTRVRLAVSGASECGIEAIPTFELHDADGVLLIVSAATASVVIWLAPGSVRQTDLQLSDWCLPAAPEPFTLFLYVNDETLVLVDGGPFPDPGGLPPCLGGGVTFTATDWGPP